MRAGERVPAARLECGLTTAHVGRFEKEAMTVYLAHFKSPAMADSRGVGFFEFESNARAGSKDNLHDARIKMLELYGADAVSWRIDKVEKQKAKTDSLDGQLQLDFRPEKKKQKRHTRSTGRL